jgi:hypothetical protein
MLLEPWRLEAERLCRDAPKWDQKVCVTQVMETSERARQLRVLLSAIDFSRAWDLRCRLRIGLVRFIARDYPRLSAFSAAPSGVDLSPAYGDTTGANHGEGAGIRPAPPPSADAPGPSARSGRSKSILPIPMPSVRHE